MLTFILYIALLVWGIAGTTLFIHRGDSNFPENTLSAFKAAFSAGASIEFDIRETADHHYVVFHDINLTRTSNGTESVKNHTLAYIRSLDAGSWHHARFKDERIPLFNEVIAQAKAVKVSPIMIELKEISNCHHFLDHVQKHMKREQFVLFSKKICLKELHDRFPDRFITIAPKCNGSRREMLTCMKHHKNTIYGANILKLNLRYFSLEYIRIAKSLNMTLLLNVAGLKEDSEELKKIMPYISHFPYVCSDFNLHY